MCSTPRQYTCVTGRRAAELRALLLRDGGGVSAGSRKLQTDCVSARCERACECVDVGVITHVFRLSRSRSTCAWRAGLGAISEQLSAVCWLPGWRWTASSTASRAWMLARSSACLQNAALQFGFEHKVFQPILLCKLLQLGAVLALGYLRRYAISGTQWQTSSTQKLELVFSRGAGRVRAAR